MYAIETHNLVKKFGDIVAVDGISIRVKEGEIFGLLGPNGAGKTTTISMLCCMIKPTSGEAYVNGYDILKHPNEVRKSIGIVFQEPAIDDRLTGRENMEIHAMLYNVPRKIMKQRIDEALELVELTDRADHLVRTYSGGMRRRLEIARGLIHRPKVLFLDEPSLGLDPQTRERIWDYIEGMAERENMTIILTTHYMEEADRLCDRVAIIDFGKIKVEGSPSELKNSLGGDVITVKTKELDKLAEIMSEYDFVKDVKKTSDALKLSVENGEEFISTIAIIARDNGVPVESLTHHKPTLNDVFLHYTGREIREEGGAGGMMMLRMMMGGRRR
ncbi:MAG: ATP-binding cassette domain-containing protein [Candidatus Freyrarchaeum guaymaensis]